MHLTFPRIQATRWGEAGPRPSRRARRAVPGSRAEDLMGRRLLSFTQVVTTLLRENRAFREEGQ